MAYLEWIVFASPFSRRDRDKSLGYRVALRKKHMVNLRDSIDEGLIDKIEFQTRVSA